MNEPSPEPQDQAIQEFWEETRRYARVGILTSVLGTPWGTAMAPPAWRFGDTPDLADELLGLVLSGAKTATTGLLSEYDQVPEVGDLSIILDGGGMPRALVRDTEIAVVPFAAITAAQAAAEGEGDGTLASWREDHREYWRRGGVDVDDDTPVVWERFAVLYPR
ncbi:MAG: ASCH domain-containing protein [Actinomycetia bacterium]|nr:ASCH domain-containing protein [Actinomycetes bacterium]